MAERWTAETRDAIAPIIADIVLEQAGEVMSRHDAAAAAVDVLTALADAGLLVELGAQGELDAAWRHNAKLHNDMRRRIQRVATNAAAEQRSLSWVADELVDILDDPQAWRGETAREASGSDENGAEGATGGQQ